MSARLINNNFNLGGKGQKGSSNRLTGFVGGAVLQEENASHTVRAGMESRAPQRRVEKPLKAVQRCHSRAWVTPLKAVC